MEWTRNSCFKFHIGIKMEIWFGVVRLSTVIGLDKLTKDSKIIGYRLTLLKMRYLLQLTNQIGHTIRAFHRYLLSFLHFNCAYVISILYLSVSAHSWRYARCVSFEFAPTVLVPVFVWCGPVYCRSERDIFNQLATLQLFTKHPWKSI